MIGVATVLISSTSSKAPETSTHSSPELTVIIGGVGIDREEVFGPVRPHVLRSLLRREKAAQCARDGEVKPMPSSIDVRIRSRESPP